MTSIGFDRVLTIAEVGRTRSSTRTELADVGTAEMLEVGFAIHTPCFTYTLDLCGQNTYALFTNKLLEECIHYVRHTRQIQRERLSVFKHNESEV